MSGLLKGNIHCWKRMYSIVWLTKGKYTLLEAYVVPTHVDKNARYLFKPRAPPSTCAGMTIYNLYGSRPNAHTWKRMNTNCVVAGQNNCSAA